MKHLQENNVTYFQHLLFAWKIAGALFIHGLIPNVLVTYASDKLCKKHASED